MGKVRGSEERGGFKGMGLSGKGKERREAREKIAGREEEEKNSWIYGEGKKRRKNKKRRGKER